MTISAAPLQHTTSDATSATVGAGSIMFSFCSSVCLSMCMCVCHPGLHFVRYFRNEWHITHACNVNRVRLLCYVLVCLVEFA